MSVRKAIHVDMDAFFASVEQRDNPELCTIAIELLDAAFETLGNRLIGIGISNFSKDEPEESLQMQFDL